MMKIVLVTDNCTVIGDSHKDKKDDNCVDLTLNIAVIDYNSYNIDNYETDYMLSCTIWYYVLCNK